MPTNRDWMWRRIDVRGYLVDEFVEGVKEFLTFAYAHPDCVNSEKKIRCPCSECRNRYFFIQKDVRYHLVKYGFTRGYDIWHAHGEPMKKARHSIDCERVQNEDGSRYKTMVMEGIEQGTEVFVDNKSARVSENYIEKRNDEDEYAQHSFDFNSWCDHVVGRPSKRRVYGHGRDSRFGRSYNGNLLVPTSNETFSNEENKKLSKEIENMRAASKRMEQEILEIKKTLELVMIESRTREEKLIEGNRKRDENLEDMVRKMIQEVVYTNSLFPGGSGFRE